MDTKLTLKLDETIIAKAKVFAKEQHTSLSKIFENYLKSLLPKEESKIDELEISDFVKSLSINAKFPADYDARKEYQEHLIEKYS